MDDADRSEVEIENNLKAAFAKSRKPVAGLVACGACHWCGDAVMAGRIFCDDPENGCQKDWQHDKDWRAANGQ